MIESGIITTAGFIFLFFKLKPETRQKLLGYDIYVDVAITVLLTLLFASTGTQSGMMTAMVSGVFISAFLLMYKKYGFYQRYDRKTKTWTVHLGQWRKEFVEAVYDHKHK